jgi:hypothetical protein
LYCENKQKHYDRDSRVRRVAADDHRSDKGNDERENARENYRNRRVIAKADGSGHDSLVSSRALLTARSDSPSNTQLRSVGTFSDEAPVQRN